MRYIIQWTNKYSGESGYVASISEKNRYFNNTYNVMMLKDIYEKAMQREQLLSLYIMEKVIIIILKS